MNEKNIDELKEAYEQGRKDEKIRMLENLLELNTEIKLRQELVT